MKKNNDMLKKALEEAAGIELRNLPEEKQIIRPYSDKFQKEMNTLFENEKTQTAYIRRRPKVKLAALVAAVIVLCLSLSAGAITVLLGTGTIDYDVEGAEATDADIKIPETIWDNKDGTFTVVPEKYEKRELDVLSYDGGEIKAVFTINNEAEPMFRQKAILITLGGIRQEFTVKCDGETTENTMLYKFDVKPLTEKKIYISFTPNVGKAGDELQMTTYVMYNPDTELKEKGDVDEMVSHHHDVIDIGYNKVIMNVDAPGQTPVADDFSGKEVIPVDKRAIKSYNEMEAEFYAFMYSDIDKFFTSDGFHTKMYADSGKDEELTISLLGDGGTYRLSLYINNELMPVFDGKSYIDVVTSEENQTDLKVKLDTTGLEKVNSCYILYEEISESFQPLTQHRGTEVYKLIVK
ncbi:MAG: hypothetical protein IJC79_04765 [Clostridia bacterium]|nr:hypothetical protein [Clostridia bacterium]